MSRYVKPNATKLTAAESGGSCEENQSAGVDSRRGRRVLLRRSDDVRRVRLPGDASGEERGI